MTSPDKYFPRTNWKYKVVFFPYPHNIHSCCQNVGLHKNPFAIILPMHKSVLYLTTLRALKCPFPNHTCHFLATLAVFWHQIDPAEAYQSSIMNWEQSKELWYCRDYCSPSQFLEIGTQTLLKVGLGSSSNRKSIAELRTGDRKSVV